MSAPATAARDGDARRTRRQQLVLFSAIAAVLLLVFAFWLTAGGGKAPPPAARIEAELAGPGTAEESWTRRSEARLGVIETRLREMDAENRRLATDNERLEAELRAATEDARTIIDVQAAAIEELGRLAAAAQPEAPAPGGAVFETVGVGLPDPGDAPSLAPATGPIAPPLLIETFRLDDAGANAGGLTGRLLGAWLPAGSHAEAVVLAGVDASAGIASQSDPRPVLLRIVGPAWTAAEDGTALAVDLEGCTVTGAAHGDLSSEKIYARLRTLTCTGPEPGTVVETEVAGFVAGAGKTGVRGPVVSREGALVEKAFLAGLVSGLGEGAAGAFAPQTVAAGAGAAAASPGLADLGRAGLGGGARTAGQKVADYLIRRAEQYQPVIQLQAGTRVTVVFLEGTRLDGKDQG